MLLTNGHILPMTGANIPNGYVKIDDGKISGVGSMENAPHEEQRLDLGGCYVCPGFIDSHTHLGMWADSLGSEGSDGNDAEAVMPHLRAIDGVNPLDKCFSEALYGGVTTIVTGPGSANPIAGQFLAMKTKGIKIDDMSINDSIAMKFAFGENPKRVHGKKKQTPSTRMGTAAIIRKHLMEAVHYSKNTDPNKFDVIAESLIPVIKGETIVKAHAHRADDIFTALRIKKEFGLKMTIEHCTEGHLIVDYLKDEQVGVCVGPMLTDRSKPELKELSYKTARILMKAGICVSIITDHPVTPQHELRLCAQLAVREGMDSMDALRAITINAAKNAGLEHRIGAIDVGMDADLLMFSEFPLDFTSKCLGVILEGEQVYLPWEEIL